MESFAKRNFETAGRERFIEKRKGRSG